MCKIIAFTDTKKLNLKKCVNDIGNTLLKTEQDGFGYAVEGKTGVFGEKCTVKHFKSRLESKFVIQLPIVKKSYMRFGMPNELTGAGIFHGRTSTNSEGLVNTHPMQRPDADGFWHLIHNGVVRDLGDQYSKLTDNDSEDVLHRLMVGIDEVKRGVSDNPMSQIEEFLEGYYAFAAIDPQGQLHIARDSYATLYMAWSEALETYIIATTESLINKLNKMLDAKIGPIDEVEDDVYMVFQGNNLVSYQFIKPLGFSMSQAAKSQASLGRELPQSNLTANYGNGGEVVSRGKVMSESEWNTQAELDEALVDALGDEQDAERLDDAETDYYKYRHELDNMDASYTICDGDGTYIKLHEFRKLDHVSQELCTIVRADGTLVELDDHLMYTHRLA